MKGLLIILYGMSLYAGNMVIDRNSYHYYVKYEGSDGMCSKDGIVHANKKIVSNADYIFLKMI
jgi:hypothetical protein